MNSELKNYSIRFEIKTANPAVDDYEWARSTAKAVPLRGVGTAFGIIEGHFTFWCVQSAINPVAALNISWQAVEKLVRQRNVILLSVDADEMSKAPGMPGRTVEGWDG